MASNEKSCPFCWGVAPSRAFKCKCGHDFRGYQRQRVATIKRMTPEDFHKDLDDIKQTLPRLRK